MSSERSFLDWDPLLSPDQVYADYLRFEYLTASSSGAVYWLEGRASEKGRNVLVRYNGSVTEDLTPKEFYVRSRVHEYGGRPYCTGTHFAYFVNLMDQRIYRQDLTEISKIIALTPEKNADGSLGKYMDLCVLPDESRLFFIYEQEFPDHSTPKNTIAFINLVSASDSPQEPTILIEGNDFYADLTLSTDGTHCLWLTWNLPAMPWDFTELWSAQITSSGFSQTSKIAGGSGESIISPVFGPSNEIFFVMDFPDKSSDNYQNWWNLYKYSPKINKIFSLSKELVEFGFPLWSSGNKSIQSIASSSELLCIYKRNGSLRLTLLDLQQLKFSKIALPYTVLGSFVFANNKLFIIAAGPQTPQIITSFDLRDNLVSNEKVLVRSIPEKYILSSPDISVGKLIQIPTKDNEKAYGYFYKPKNSNYSSIKSEKPPLLILVHGGPTASSNNAYSSYNQYWTSSGFAILDFEYRGSTGFGRQFRGKLYGQWGLLEISDLADAIDYLSSKNVIANKVAITGSSAGGYTVQRALTEIPDLFQVGGSHYGIGNLLTLRNLTHKFESTYLLLLIGQDDQPFIDRSPVNHLDQLKSPMILFQGSEDKIVPPDISREIAQILKEKGIKSDYIEYAGESHGFRQLETKVDALTKESNFFKEVLKSN